MYLVVFSYSEDEVYHFNNKKEMLNYFIVKTIKELLLKENRLFCNCYVYKISKEWKI